MHGLQQTLFASDHQAHAGYMIGVYPNGEIAGEVAVFRQQLSQVIGDFTGQHLTPYLILMSFSMLPDAEDELVKKLDDFCFKRLRSANVELSGFHHADETRSILIEPRQMTFLSSLIRKISGVVKPVGNNKIRQVKHPGALVLASGLSNEKYKAAQDTFSNKVYARICFANNLVLLRETGESRPLVAVKSFSLL